MAKWHDTVLVMAFACVVFAHASAAARKLANDEHKIMHANAAATGSKFAEVGVKLDPNVAKPNGGKGGGVEDEKNFISFGGVGGYLGAGGGFGGGYPGFGGGVGGLGGGVGGLGSGIGGAGGLGVGIGGSGGGFGGGGGGIVP